MKVSATEYNIDRGVVDKILENQADLMRTARIVPEQENGKLVGIRMFGVRPDTLLGTLGMQNGDRLQTINGFDMTSPEKALEAYARLRTADKLTVSLNRGGQPLNLAPADLPLTVEAVAHARAMVTRYEQAVATHPPAGTPLNRRQQAEADNLAHWRRRLDAITRAHQP